VNYFWELTLAGRTGSLCFIVSSLCWRRLFIFLALKQQGGLPHGFEKNSVSAAFFRRKNEFRAAIRIATHISRRKKKNSPLPYPEWKGKSGRSGYRRKGGALVWRLGKKAKKGTLEAGGTRNLVLTARARAHWAAAGKFADRLVLRKKKHKNPPGNPDAVGGSGTWPTRGGAGRKLYSPPVPRRTPAIAALDLVLKPQRGFLAITGDVARQVACPRVFCLALVLEWWSELATRLAA